MVTLPGCSFNGCEALAGGGSIKKFILIGLPVYAVTTLLVVEPVVASTPGIVFDGFNWLSGQAFYWVMTAVMLPMFGKMIRESFIARKVRKDLQRIARYYPLFEWSKFQETVKDCFLRVHSDWTQANLSDTPEWMTEWCWQNQQLPRLERYKREGLVNICDVRKIYPIKPLKIVHEDSGGEHEHPMIVVSIEASLLDYVEDTQTGKVVDGKKVYEAIKVIWHFTLVNHVWKLSSMEDGDPQYLTYSVET